MDEAISLKGWGNQVLTSVTLEMDGVCKTKGKRNCICHCTLINKVVSHMGNRLPILKQLYIYTGIEQLSKWMVDGGS